MPKEKNNILIAGSEAVVDALAKKLSKYPECGKIYAAPGGSVKSDFYESVDIREDDVTGLLKFALENGITLTIPVTARAFKADVAGFFTENGQGVFGPSADACKIAFNNVYGKKFLYKIHAQTAKFGAFDKMQQAEDYLKTAQFPVTIKCNEYDGVDDRLVCTTTSLAADFLEALFAKNETGVLIEGFTYGLNFTVYYVTDGYSAVPLPPVRNYKFMQDGDGGILTNGMGCFTPDYKISELVLSRVDNIVKNTLTALAKKSMPYVGILGLDCTMTSADKFYVNEFKPFLQDFDASAVLNLIEDNLINVFRACVDGIFADEWAFIRQNNLASVSALVMARQDNKIIEGLDCIDDIKNVDFGAVTQSNDNKYLAHKGAAFTITRTASTLNRAKNCLYDDLNVINFSGMKYRRDILR